MADYELVAGTVWQFATSVSCQRNFAHKVLKHPPCAESSNGAEGGHGSESESREKGKMARAFILKDRIVKTNRIPLSVKETSL